MEDTGRNYQYSTRKKINTYLLSANDKYPVFHGGLDPLGYYYNANRPADTVMIINVGASAGTVWI